MQIDAHDAQGEGMAASVWRGTCSCALKRWRLAKGRSNDGQASLPTVPFWERADDPVDGTELGLCRRLPPTYGGWPMTGPDDWCGEWREC